MLAIDGQHNGAYINPAIDGNSALLCAVAVLPEDTITTLMAGWVAYFEKPQGPLTRDLDGLLCVIGWRNPEGELVLRVRRLVFTMRDGVFHLTAEPQPTLFEQPVEWAARVVALAPG